MNCQTEQIKEIYEKEVNNSINFIKSFKESLSFLKGDKRHYFEFADENYYLNECLVRPAEYKTKIMLENIFSKLIKYYNIPSQDLNNMSERYNICFILIENNKRIGFVIKDFSSNEFDNTFINKIVSESKIDELNVILFQEAFGYMLSFNNAQYQKNRIKCKEVTASQFVERFFGTKELLAFEKEMKSYAAKVNDILGIKTLRRLTNMNFFEHRQSTIEMLNEFEYEKYIFQFVNLENEYLKKKSYLNNFEFEPNLIKEISTNYLERKRYLSMVGESDYANSFLTSEWLYNSLQNCNNFDFTAIISGYLKSIEQLLFFVVRLNADKGLKIALSNERGIRNKAIENQVKVYTYDKKQKIYLESTDRKKDKMFIDLTSSQIEYANSQLGSSILFVRNNKNIFIDSSLSKSIADMVDSFKDECRNGYFHTHNLHDWATVEKTRSNAIYLYCLLLGSLNITKEKEKYFKIKKCDDFDELCSKIVEFKKKNWNEFIFEYSNGVELDLSFCLDYYDYSDGERHCTKMLFYPYGFNDFGNLESEVFLTRDNMPKRIYGKYRNGSKEEL